MRTGRPLPQTAGTPAAGISKARSQPAWQTSRGRRTCQAALLRARTGPAVFPACRSVLSLPGVPRVPFAIQMGNLLIKFIEFLYFLGIFATILLEFIILARIG